jgi:ribose transport system permease protein
MQAKTMQATISGRLPGLIRQWSRLGLLIINLGFWLAFIFTAEGFLTDFNLFSLLRFAAVQVMIGYAQMITLGVGEMNLSVGAIGVIVAMFTGGLMQALHIPTLLAVILGLLFALIPGAINGLLVVFTGINSFIITLATSSIYTGLMLISTKAKAFDTLPEDFVNFGRLRLFDLFISPLVIITLLVAAALLVLFRYTVFGREMLAVGANRRAALMSGVSTPRIIILAHTLSGLLAGLAGIMLISMLGSAIPSIGGDWLLISFAAPAIGGTIISGGYVSVFGTLMGGLLFGTLANGILLLNVSTFWLNLFIGLVLLLAVGLDRLRNVYASQAAVQPLAQTGLGEAQ